MKYGYARVSTDGQSIDAQVRQLTKAGYKKIVREVASGAKTDRAQLRRLLDRLEPGDALAVTRLDRLARSTRATADLGAIGATYNLTMDPYEKYDMTFNGAAPTRVLSTSPGKYSGQDNAWVLALIGKVMVDFDQSIMKFPSLKRSPGGASTDLIPNLQHPEDPLPILRGVTNPHAAQGGGG